MQKNKLSRWIIFDHEDFSAKEYKEYLGDRCTLYKDEKELNTRTLTDGIAIPNIYRRGVKRSGLKSLASRVFDCADYYPHFPKESLLSGDHVLISWENLYANPARMFDYFKTDHLFIRPNSGLKEFTGTTFHSKWAKSELDCIRSLPNSSIDDKILCLVSKARPIQQEARFLVINNKVIDGSLYTENEGEYDKMLAAAKEFCKNHAGIYILDVCMSDSVPYVVEINSFECSGLYSMDVKTVCDAVDKYYAKINSLLAPHG